VTRLKEYKGAGDSSEILRGVRYLVEFDTFDIAAAAEVSRPFCLGIRLNRHCNLSCSYCLSASGPKLPNTTENPVLADEVFSSWLPSRIVFCGGEPTLAPNLPQLASIFKRRGCFTVVASNGLEFPSREILDEVTWYDVSFHGTCPGTFKRTTGFDGFRTVAKNVRALASSENVRVACNFVMTSARAGPYLELCQKLCDWGVRKIRFARMLPIGRGQRAIRNAPRPDELREFSNTIREADLPAVIVFPAVEKFEAVQNGYFILENDGRFSSPVLLRGLSPREAVANPQWGGVLDQHVALFRGNDG